MGRVVSRSARRVFYAALSFAAALVLLFAFVQVRQQLFRQRAERLYRDAMSIRMRRTSFRDLEPLLQRWNEDVTHSDICSRQHCDLRIRIAQWPAYSGFYWNWLEKLRGFYSFLGGRGSYASLDINVRNGFVWGEHFAVGTEGTIVLDERIFRNQVIGLEISSQPRADPWHLIRSVQPPGVEFRSPIKLPGVVKVSVTPYAEPAEIQRLSQINFSCITALRPCRNNEGIAPIAATELAKYQQQFSAVDHLGCTLVAVRDISRDAEAAVIVDLLADQVTPSSDFEDATHTLRVRLRERIKRADFWEIGSDQALKAQPISIPPRDELTELRPGDRLVILFDRWTRQGKSPDLVAEVCGVLPATPENLQLVRSGTADDERVEPLIEYDPQFEPKKVTDPPSPVLPPPY